MKQTIHIVGGGLAGLTLAIALRQRDVPVQVWESGSYPRHKVCGEFISGAGLEVLERLGLHPLLVEQGALTAKTISFANVSQQSTPKHLPDPALCLSRYALDYLLSKQLRQLGGSLHEHSTWNKPSGPGVIFSSGRKPSPTVEGWRWFGLKSHATNVSIQSDLEMHFARNAYVGICRIGENLFNICGLFRNQPGQPSRINGPERLRGSKGSPLHQRLEEARFLEKSFCAVAGLNLRPTKTPPAEGRIGDAMSMIPPVTGNGMSIALESAEISAPILEQYARSDLNWPEATSHLSANLHSQFTERLFWANELHKILFSSQLQTRWLARIPQIPLLLRLFFRLTR